MSQVTRLILLFCFLKERKYFDGAKRMKRKKKKKKEEKEKKKKRKRKNGALVLGLSSRIITESEKLSGREEESHIPSFFLFFTFSPF